LGIAIIALKFLGLARIDALMSYLDDAAKPAGEGAALAT
jgi:hypothetical protein